MIDIKCPKCKHNLVMSYIIDDPNDYYTVHYCGCTSECDFSVFRNEFNKYTGMKCTIEMLDEFYHLLSDEVEGCNLSYYDEVYDQIGDEIVSCDYIQIDFSKDLMPQAEDIVKKLLKLQVFI